MDNEPLIWTSKGNLPIASLEYETQWFFNSESVKFVERYKLAGETVKEAAHVYLLPKHRSGAQQGTVG